jgi:prepilin peptidase CpaA
MPSVFDSGVGGESRFDRRAGAKSIGRAFARSRAIPFGSHRRQPCTGLVIPVPERVMTFSALAATVGVVLFPLAVVYAGLMDLATLTIRNTLVLGLAISWLLLAPLAGFGAGELAASLSVAAAVFAITFGFFALGWIGGGDAKLAAVTALWFAPDEALLYFTYASLLGGLLTLLIISFRAQLLPATLCRFSWIVNLHDSKTGVPYGAAMAPAALIVFPDTAWLAHAAI